MLFPDTVNNWYTFALGRGEISDNGSFNTKPAIVGGLPEHLMVVAEEGFGPIVPVRFWVTEDEVISRINNTSSGLSGAIWLSDENYTYALAMRIKAGTVWINSFGKPFHKGSLLVVREAVLTESGTRQACSRI